MEQLGTEVYCLVHARPPAAARPLTRPCRGTQSPQPNGSWRMRGECVLGYPSTNAPRSRDAALFFRVPTRRL
eukprot:5261769-Prymnesium_polylepis.1